MKNAILFNFLVDKENKQIKVERSFDANIDLVWSAWTEPEILDQWWAPKPYRVETKSQNFVEGGRWHYAMISPEGNKHWCLFDFETIAPKKKYSGLDSFCDENENLSTDMPRMHWDNSFSSPDAETTLVTCIIEFKELGDLEKIVEMGFKEGFTMGMGNLDELLIELKNK